jgi:hypothetical protein
MLGSTLIRYQVVEVREPREKRLLAPPWMMKPFHHEELALKSVMGLIQEGAGCRHLRVCEHRIPARLLVLAPPPDTLPMGHPRFLSHVVSKMAEPLTERKHAQALALARPVAQGVALRAEGRAHWRSDSSQLLRELVERVAQAEAETRPRKQGPHTLCGAVEAIGEDPLDPVRRLRLGGRALTLAIGLGKGGGTGVLGLSQMPDHPATDNRRQVDFVSETVTMLLVGQEVGGQRQPTPRQHRDHPVLTAGTDQTVEGHGREVTDHRAPLHTEPPVRGHQGIAGPLRSPLAIAPDEVREDRAYGFARGALETPDGDPTQADTHGMGVTWQAPSPITGRLVFQLKAEGEEERQHPFEKRLAVAKQLKVGRFMLKIDRDGPIFAGLAGFVSHGSPSSQMVVAADDPG